MLKSFAWILVCPVLLAGTCGPVDSGLSGLTGDVDRGRVLYENGDGNNTSCVSCHCTDASGGCRLGAPAIQGESADAVGGRTRDSGVPHGGGKFTFSDQDIADIAAYLQSLGG